jgi:4-hydroxybenzoate polyprenyltransferase
MQVYRELLMDIADVDGDRSAGVRTVPVLLGRNVALVLAMTVLTAGFGATALSLHSSGCGAGYMTALAAAAAPLYANAAAAKVDDYSEKSVSRAVDLAFGPLLLVLIILGVAPQL